jgi:hypothetical protein
MRGSLGDFSLADLLTSLARGRETGKLTLTRSDGLGVVLFRRGRIIYAGSNAVRETVGNVLICRRLITEDTLRRALESFNRAEGEARLGNILVDMGAISRDTLHEVMRDQVAEVLEELGRWIAGYFKFERLEIPEHGEIEVDAEELALTGGGADPDVVVKLAVPESPAGSGDDVAGDGDDRAAERMASLAAVMAEIRSPSFTGEVSLRLLGYATQVVERGVLFVTRSELARGMGQFGIQLDGGGSADARVRALELPLDEPSVLAEVVGRREPYQGALADTPVNRRLAGELGGGGPNEVIAVPMAVSGGVALVLYGDNLPSGRPIGRIHGLEQLIVQAGLAREKVVLERRMAHVQERLTLLRQAEPPAG